MIDPTQTARYRALSLLAAGAAAAFVGTSPPAHAAPHAVPHDPPAVAETHPSGDAIFLATFSHQPVFLAPAAHQLPDHQLPDVAVARHDASINLTTFGDRSPR
jgi:hypothetical protein